jgi:hypothetical protein
MTDGAQLRHLEEYAEAACDKMYDAGSPSGATALYSDAKEPLADAIGRVTEGGRYGTAVFPWLTAAHCNSSIAAICFARSHSEKPTLSLANEIHISRKILRAILSCGSDTMFMARSQSAALSNRSGWRDMARSSA